tara:strand:+ start:208 stop:834 length:627 start_codon:yes stop_codon:yes gene_type:complete
LEKKLQSKEIVSKLREAYGIKKFFTWARPWICPFDKFIFQVPKNQSIFDVGCGNGAFLFLLATFREPKKLYGVDVSENNLSIVKNIFPNTKYNKVNNISDWPKENFNVITVLDVLHHIKPEEQHEFINKILNKIKPGGTLIIKDMSTKPWYFAIMNTIHDLIFANQLIHYFPFNELIQIIKKNGFEIQEINSKILLWYSHEWVVAKKK